MKRIPAILRASKANIHRAAACIRSGGVVAFPTETLYGLAADALSGKALQRVLYIKRRDPVHNIPILVSDLDMLERVVSGASPLARRLMKTHWPGPLTLILPAAEALPAPLVGAGGGIGVRISSDPVASSLVAAVGGPISATSANLTSEPPATSAAEANLPGISLVLDDGPREELASTVISLLGEPKILRQGAAIVDLDPCTPRAT